VRGPFPLIFIERSVAVDIEQLKSKIDQFLVDMNYELYDLNMVKERKQKILRIFIDKPEGVNMEDVVEVTKALNPFIDELDPIEGEYMLEVSSPGAERELRSQEAIKHAIGRLVHIKTFTQEFEGDLVSFNGESITLKIKNKKVSINYMDVQKIRLAIDFRRKK
jgi:ribosome maturation factor RimP